MSHIHSHLCIRAMPIATSAASQVPLHVPICACNLSTLCPTPCPYPHLCLSFVPEHLCTPHGGPQLQADHRAPELGGQTLSIPSLTTIHCWCRDSRREETWELRRAGGGKVDLAHVQAEHCRACDHQEVARLLPGARGLVITGGESWLHAW